MRPPPPESVSDFGTTAFPETARYRAWDPSRTNPSSPPPVPQTSFPTSSCDPGEVAPRYAWQGGEREGTSCVQHVAAVYGGGVDFYEDLSFRRIRPRNSHRLQLRRIPKAFDQDGLHLAFV